MTIYRKTANFSKKNAKSGYFSKEGDKAIDLLTQMLILLIFNFKFYYFGKKVDYIGTKIDYCISQRAVWVSNKGDYFRSTLINIVIFILV